MSLPLLYIDKVKYNNPQFEAAVRSIANELGVNANWLMLIMYIESGLNSQAQNTTYPVYNGYATGLIQFLPDTAKGLGTSTQQLIQMSNVEQLQYVKKYFQQHYLKVLGVTNSFEDMYAGVFLPIMVGKPNDYIAHTTTLTKYQIAKSNPIFDLDKNGAITKLEFDTYVRSQIPAAYLGEFKKKVGSQETPIC